MDNREFLFNKEDKRWYIYLPDWKGAKASLEMVAGADVVLDELSDNTDSVAIKLATDKEAHEFHFKRLLIPPKGIGSGAFYTYLKSGVPKRLVWLCDVTKFVFNDSFPKHIRFNVIKQNQ